MKTNKITIKVGDFVRHIRTGQVSQVFGIAYFAEGYGIPFVFLSDGILRGPNLINGDWVYQHEVGKIETDKKA